ncbi:MAG: hydroxymethylglutaryl-CoA reductase [Bacteroidetes bacterium 4572_114]|nr:MAG: hydroxymethylglutaryl-CoA reductase [Bacteroidetes bacterium 4572_114]
MTNNKILSGFSRLTKDEKIEMVAGRFGNTGEIIRELKSYLHYDPEKQRLFDEFSENTISNFYFPFAIAPNFLINDKMYMVPMVIEESSVVAAASNGAKYWATKGGFKARVISTTKVGQVHFIWQGEVEKLQALFPMLKDDLISKTKHITANMETRGGGILDIELVDMTDEMENYFQLKASFDTRNAMGANFINSCLEEFAVILKDHFAKIEYYTGQEKTCCVIMSIMSNYTPECLVKTEVECSVDCLKHAEDVTDPDSFVRKFEKAVRIAQIDPYRATTHNKGIFNGIDAVALATGNDFRAIEACGHAYAARDGRYRGLTDVDISNDKFKYSLTIPLSLGTVGGLTSLHPLAKFSMQLLGNPSAVELMMIAASVGLANNFGAIKSLVTRGIQVGHMKMHLLNILNSIKVNEKEKDFAVAHFANQKVSYHSVNKFVTDLRKEHIEKVG